MLSHLAVPGRRASAALARSPVLALRSPRSILASAEVRRGAHLLAAAHRTGPRFLVPPRRVAAHRFAQLMEVQFRPVFRRAAPLHGMLFSSAARSAARTTRTTARGVALSSKTTFTHPLDFPCYVVAAGLAACGVASLTERMWHAPRPLVSVVRLEKPKTEFSHPYDRKPWWWRYWFISKRLAYLTLLWIPCGTVALVSYLTGDPDIRTRYLKLMVRTLEWAGCSFQKFGQWLSMRPDILSGDVIDVLSELRDNTDPHDMEHNREQFRLSFGCELEEIFEWFDPEPIASASVGQVHRATLRPKYAMEGGTVDVAVKVRHPRVLAETWIDTWMIFAFMDNSGGLLTMPFSQNDFTLMLQKQFDFEWEAYNMSKFAENFAAETGNSILRFPAVSGDLLSPSVLVESWGKGRAVDSLFSAVGKDWEVLEEGTATAVGASVHSEKMKNKKVVRRVETTSTSFCALM